MIVILTAVIVEAQPIAEALGLSKRSSTHWANEHVHLHVAGIRAAHFSVDTLPPETMGAILAGIAGALDPALAIGDVLIDSASTALPASPPCRIGAIHSASKIVATPQEKAAVFQQTGALAVEMEAAIIRPAIAERNLPFLHVRAISDTATETLNPAVLNLVDPLGRPKPMAITAALVKNPALITTLTRLRQTSSLATANLAKLLSTLLANGWPHS